MSPTTLIGTATSMRSASEVIWPAATLTALESTGLPSIFTQPDFVAVTVCVPGSRASKKTQPLTSVLRWVLPRLTGMFARGVPARSMTTRAIAPRALLGSKTGALTRVSARTGVALPR